jgi:hypothetical protein
MIEKSLQIIFLVLFAFGISGCDGAIGMKGRVYEYLQPAPEYKSTIYVDTLDSVPPTQLKVVSGAEVVIEPWTPDKRGENPNAELFTLRGKSDGNGYFELKQTAKPGAYDATMTVSCPGYSTVQKVFKHDRLYHNAIVVLVREKR